MHAEVVIIIGLLPEKILPSFGQVAEPLDQLLDEQDSMLQRNMHGFHFAIPMEGQGFLDIGNVAARGNPGPEIMIVHPGRTECLVEPAHRIQDLLPNHRRRGSRHVALHKEAGKVLAGIVPGADDSHRLPCPVDVRHIRDHHPHLRPLVQHLDLPF